MTRSPVPALAALPTRESWLATFSNLATPAAITLAAGMLVAVALLASPAALHAQWVRAGPALLRNDDATVLGARATIDLRGEGSTLVGCYPRDRAAYATADIPLAWEAERNPESVRASVGAALEISLFCPADVPTNAEPGVDYGGGFDLGFVGVGVAVGAEAPQSLDFVDLTLGVALAYEHSQPRRLWFLPAVEVQVQAVACVSCELPVPDDESGHVRVDADVEWRVSLERDRVPTGLHPVWVRVGGRGFKAFALPDGLAAVRRSEGYSGRVVVGYRPDRVEWLHEVYVRWSGGELPVLAGRERALIAGVLVTL